MTESSFRLIVHTLQGANVRSLVVGDLAVAAHGAMSTGMRIDLACAEEDLPRGKGVMVELGFKETADGLQQGEDCVRYVKGRGRESEIYLIPMEAIRFHDLWERARFFELGDISVVACGFYDLLAMKRRSGRAEDAIEIEQLELARGEPFDLERAPWFAGTFEGSARWNLQR